MKALRMFCVMSLLIAQIGVYAANPGDVVINEIAWMGTTFNEDDEWIELINTTDSDIDITDWTLSAAVTTPNITLSGSVPANGYFLFERIDDNTISDIVADQIYSGSLSNSGEQLFLKDAASITIDEVDCSSGWFAGDNSTKSTMERLHPSIPGSNSDSWGTNNGTIKNGADADGNPINGTPKAENSVYDISLSVEMSSFSAAQRASVIVLHWTTESEVDVQGFFLSRSDGPSSSFMDINTAMIPCKGDGSSGEVYEFTDYSITAEGTYTYRLDEVDLKGKRHFLALKTMQVSHAEAAPAGFYFIRSYPNPFNPSTTIEFHISPQTEGKQISLIVYDLLGRPVQKLIQGNYRTGFFQTQWDGKNEQGNEMPSGFYFAMLKVDGQLHASKRLIKMQ